MARRPITERRLRRPGLGLPHTNLIIFWAMLFNELSVGFYQTLSPLYIESLGASPGLVGVVIGVQGLVRLFFLAPAGWIADRIPMRTLIVGGRSMTVVGLVLYGLAQEWWQLLPAILIMSVGNVSFPVISKAIADSSDDATRTRAFTLIYTVGPSSALIISPLLAGPLADGVALRAIYFAAAAASAISVIFFTRLRPVEISVDDEPGGGYRDVFAFRPILIVCGVFMALLLVLTTGFTLVPNYLQDVHGVGIRAIGQFGSVFALGSVILGVAIARVKGLSRPWNALLLSTLLCPVAFLLFYFGGSIWIFGARVPLPRRLPRILESDLLRAWRGDAKPLAVARLRPAGGARRWRLRGRPLHRRRPLRCRPVATASCSHHRHHPAGHRDALRAPLSRRSRGRGAGGLTVVGFVAIDARARRCSTC